MENGEWTGWWSELGACGWLALQVQGELNLVRHCEALFSGRLQLLLAACSSWEQRLTQSQPLPDTPPGHFFVGHHPIPSNWPLPGTAKYLTYSGCTADANADAASPSRVAMTAKHVALRIYILHVGHHSRGGGRGQNASRCFSVLPSVSSPSPLLLVKLSHPLKSRSRPRHWLVLSSPHFIKPRTEVCFR